MKRENLVHLLFYTFFVILSVYGIYEANGFVADYENSKVYQITDNVTINLPEFSRTGKIKVLTKGPAKVYLDGVQIGSSPLTTDSLKPGKYRLDIESDGYSKYHESVEVEKGKIYEVSPVMISDSESTQFKVLGEYLDNFILWGQNYIVNLSEGKFAHIYNLVTEKRLKDIVSKTEPNFNFSEEILYSKNINYTCLNLTNQHIFDNCNYILFTDTEIEFELKRAFNDLSKVSITDNSLFFLSNNLLVEYDLKSRTAKIRYSLQSEEEYIGLLNNVPIVYDSFEKIFFAVDSNFASKSEKLNFTSNLNSIKAKILRNNLYIFDENDIRIFNEKLELIKIISGDYSYSEDGYFYSKSENVVNILLKNNVVIAIPRAFYNSETDTLSVSDTSLLIQNNNRLDYFYGSTKLNHFSIEKLENERYYLVGDKLFKYETIGNLKKISTLNLFE
ncbi:PEGA domain-containing protein [bacterium]|nr:MAG: PEGA domain-containing protein [bacterium]